MNAPPPTMPRLDTRDRYQTRDDDTIQDENAQRCAESVVGWEALHNALRWEGDHGYR